MTQNFEIKKQKNKKILSVVRDAVILTLIAALLFFSGILTYKRVVKKDPVPMIGGHAFLIIVSPSMTGTIQAGDIILVAQQPSYALGDVVTYVPAEGNMSVTHRIVRSEGDHFYTKGDANDAEDMDPVFPGQIRGKFVFRIPVLGALFCWLRTPAGIFFVVAIAGTVIALRYVLRRRKEELSEKEDSPAHETEISASGESADGNADTDGSDERLSDGSQPDGKQ